MHGSSRRCGRHSQRMNPSGFDAHGTVGGTMRQIECDVLVIGLGKTGLSCARYLSRLGEQVAGVGEQLRQHAGVADHGRDRGCAWASH